MRIYIEIWGWKDYFSDYYMYLIYFHSFGERTALHSFRELQDMYVFFVILKSISDQYQYLGNCPPTPPLTQQQSIDNKLGLMLG